MSFDEIKEAYVHGAPLDETLERLAEIGESPTLEYTKRSGWSFWINRHEYGPSRPTIREAMIAAFDAE